MTWLVNRIRRVLERSVFNPASWLAWAAVMLAAWGACHVLGWRVDTAVLSGTVDPAHGSTQWVMLRGMLYAVTYFAAVVVGPVLVLAGGVFVVLVRVTGGRKLAELGAHVVSEPHDGGTTSEEPPTRGTTSERFERARDL